MWSVLLTARLAMLSQPTTAAGAGAAKTAAAAVGKTPQDLIPSLKLQKEKRLLSTRCGHIFCASCLTESLRVTKQCPSCRAKLTGKTAFHPVFL